MRARVKETGEIVNIYSSYYPITYRAMDLCDGREWDEDELEILDQPVMVSLDEVCNWLNEHLNEYVYSYDWNRCLPDDCKTTKDLVIKNIRKHLEEKYKRE